MQVMQPKARVRGPPHEEQRSPFSVWAIMLNPVCHDCRAARILPGLASPAKSCPCANCQRTRREDELPDCESNVHIWSQRVNRTTTDCGRARADPLPIVDEAQKWGRGVGVPPASQESGVAGQESGGQGSARQTEMSAPLFYARLGACPTYRYFRFLPSRPSNSPMTANRAAFLVHTVSVGANSSDALRRAEGRGASTPGIPTRSVGTS
jgi:hypothetical protein